MSANKHDRELLELAARAAGNPKIRWNGSIWCNCERMNKPDERGNSYPSEWNPLTDDGDALRLAVYLGLTIIPNYHVEQKGGGVIAFTELDPSDDWCVPTRRAIVRAAAEIGRQMQAVDITQQQA